MIAFTFEIPTGPGWYYIVRAWAKAPQDYDVIEIRSGQELSTRPYLEAWRFLDQGLFVEVRGVDNPELWISFEQFMENCDEAIMFCGPLSEPPFPEKELYPYRKRILE